MESGSAEMEALKKLNFHILQKFHQVSLHHRNDVMRAKIPHYVSTECQWLQEVLIEPAKSELSY